METKKILDKALEIAYKAHAGQLDKGGNPYILHPLRVALHCRTEEEKMVALLHDVLEDTAVTLEDLEREGFPEEVLEAVEYLTKKDGEDYQTFIKRVSHRTLAIRVKLRDLEDNMDESRLGGKKHWKMETYREAYDYLYKELENISRY
ncbi:MAG: HD domain-containing protein [Odoribacter sp.]|nr:HD domain-containing protein [Odoribacter sp.]